MGRRPGPWLPLLAGARIHAGRCSITCSHRRPGVSVCHRTRGAGRRPEAAPAHPFHPARKEKSCSGSLVLLSPRGGFIQPAACQHHTLDNHQSWPPDALCGGAVVVCTIICIYSSDVVFPLREVCKVSPAWCGAAGTTVERGFDCRSRPSLSCTRSPPIVVLPQARLAVGPGAVSTKLGRVVPCHLPSAACLANFRFGSPSDSSSLQRSCC